MAWTTPRTWVVGEIVTAAQMNTHLRDNLNTLGRDTLHVHAGTTDWEAWYACGPAANFTPNAGVTAINTLFAVPFFPRRAGSIDRLAFEVTTAIAGNARAGIYAPKGNTNLYPGALIVDGGEISISTNGVKAATINTLLSEFLCWAVYVESGDAAIRRAALTDLPPVLGMPSTLGAAVPRNSLSVAFTYAALPSTFPTGAVQVAISNVPLISVRYSA